MIVNVQAAMQKLGLLSKLHSIRVTNLQATMNPSGLLEKKTVHEKDLGFLQRILILLFTTEFPL